MDAEQVILSRGLPKTGQTQAYGVEDDGVVEAGWWVGRKIADNKTRFIAKTLDGDDVVIDLATGLMWPADGNGGGCYSGGQLSWDTANIFCEGLDFAGFTDWRLPNIRELASLVDYGQITICIDPTFFPNTKVDVYWSSSTYVGDILKAWPIHFGTGNNRLFAKTDTYYLRAVRGGV